MVALIDSVKPEQICFEARDGYFLPDAEMISDAFEAMRFSGHGSYVIQLTGGDGMFSELTKRYVADEHETDKLRLRKHVLIEHNSLKNVISEIKNEAAEEVKRPTDYYAYTQKNEAFMFVKSQIGIVGCGWHSKSNDRKNMIMCAFIIYAFGFINRSNDEALFTSTYNYLLYETGLAEPEDFDGILLASLRKIKCRNRVVFTDVKGGGRYEQ